MKETGTIHWKAPNTAATNESGFTGLSNGMRDQAGNFLSTIRLYGTFWSATEYDITSHNAWSGGLFYNGSNLNIEPGYSKPRGFPVRCVKDTFPSFLIVNPKIYLAKAILNIDETQMVTGKDFTGPVNLTITNSLDEIIPINSGLLTYPSSGQFSYSLLITSAMPGGEYTVSAIDVSSGKSCPPAKFFINKPSVSKLWINKPQLNDSYTINQQISIQWGDYISKNLAIGTSGFVEKKYKIEITSNNGASWLTLASSYAIPNAKPGTNNNDFTYSNFTSKTAGTFKIKITDIDNPTNFSISDAFKVNAVVAGGFTYTLEWDESCPKPAGMPHPTGLAADGTARIFLKLTRNEGNSRSVNSIHAEIYSKSLVTSDPALLGKLMFLTDMKYNDLNTPTGTISDLTLDAGAGTGSYYVLCIVAPDDFTNIPSSHESERNLYVDVTINYSDNTKELVSTDKSPITIVRPPLFLVHGLAGDATSFQDAKYNLGDGIKYFDGDGLGGNQKNPVWKEAQRLNLYNYESFNRNAEVLLGINIDGGKYYNTFQSFLKAMHKKGYACNRVDYVCHSMGGCVARTVINKIEYSQGTNGFRNYKKGFINKLITINTPHNNSYLADFAIDRYRNSTVLKLLKNTPSMAGYFVNGLPSPALLDLRAYNGGVRLPKTRVKNHLIASDLDEFNQYSEPDIRFNNYYPLSFLYYLLLPSEELSVHNYIKSNYYNDDYLNNSDMVVPVSSQLPGKSTWDITDIVKNPDGVTNASITYGINKSHLGIQNDLVVGTRVMHLLNASIKSPFFADEIDANLKNQNTSGLKIGQRILFSEDSIKYYYDTSKIQIELPEKNKQVNVDSTILIKVKVKDTINLKQVRVFFQNQFYTTVSRLTYQTFDVKVVSDYIGKNEIFAEAIYDSSDFTIFYRDTSTVIVRSSDALLAFSVSPRLNALNANQIFQPTYRVTYEKSIGALNSDIDSLTFSIADTNVVRFDSNTYQFLTKDTGTTHIIFSYKGFQDTAFILLTYTDLAEEIICPGIASKTFNAGEAIEGSTYQWQVDKGNGFENIINDTYYSGATTNLLSVANIPSAWYGYKYQCLISNDIGESTTAPVTIKFGVTWTGAENNLWNNTANWNCGVLPDENTDVIIPYGVTHFPQVNTDTKVRSITVAKNASINVLPGITLELKGE